MGRRWCSSIVNSFFFLLQCPSIIIDIRCVAVTKGFSFSHKNNFIFCLLDFWGKTFSTGGRCWIVKVTRLSGVTRSAAKHGNTLVVFYFPSGKQNKNNNTNSSSPIFWLNSTNVTIKREKRKRRRENTENEKKLLYKCTRNFRWVSITFSYYLFSETHGKRFGGSIWIMWCI